MNARAMKLREASIFRAAPVPDSGIDLKRTPRGVVIRWPFGNPAAAPPPDVPLPPVIKKRCRRPAKWSKSTRVVVPGGIGDIGRIGRAVARYYGIEWDEIRCKKRIAVFVLPRQIGFALAKKITGESLPSIGRVFGGRDHTTVLHGVRKIEARAVSDAEFGTELAMLECNIRKQLGNGQHVTG